ncbi:MULTISPECIES: tyrosine-type recombinase/integrase [unclassified Nitratiruptor]|uniref:tyrosine-type recombinase/integrase n=1 Tax=unclassified Nitratiruptor TaxID=2624044 RepID=UPI001915608B|nr:MULTISPECIES: tyrosine-type recombinase/integrase [unclassified Nitratiruptor]BCD60304.1 integrase/recombinase XerD [Nitratiruptor sp. YY08-10]BCD64206.1 integrase/recombinase XerD [Nitratiruptor sp. YY08-14]
MKYPLDFKDNFENSLRFWIERYIRFKLTTLSNRQVKDQQKLANIIHSLTTGTNSIEKLGELVKEARNIGLIGVNTYYKPLEKLYKHLHTLGLASMKEIDEEMIVDFLASSTAGLSDATKKNYRIAMINFFGYINKNNEDKHLYEIELKNWGGLRGKAGQKLPVFLSEDEIVKFLHAIDTYPFRPDVAARNRAIIKMILYTGIRVSEAIHLPIKNVILQHDVYLLKIIGKGNKSRVVMIKAQKIQKDLEEWLEKRNCEKGLLFCNKKGAPLTQAYVSRMVEKILLSCGIRKEKNGAHMLRHTFATLLYNKSKDLVLVQETLGHASLDTSRIYTHFDEDKLYKAASIMDELEKE